MSQEQSQPKKDNRKGNSGRNPSDDPKEQYSIYIKRSETKALGGPKRLMRFIYKAITAEAEAQKLKKQARAASKNSSSAK